MALDPAFVATQRFGLGARPGERARIAADPRGWLRAQCIPERELPEPLAALPSTGDDLWAFFGWLFDVGRRTRRAQRRGEELPPEARNLQRAFRERTENALDARLRAAAGSDAPFRERLIGFWTNHFAVSAARPVTIALPPSFERDVVRPHVMGRFEDMLLASSKHPAMLLYLDNERSIGPSSQRARHPRKRRLIPIDPPTGLNENLAREILELHTLGVDGGYDQDDVTRFAKVLTGWRIKVRPFFRGFYDGDELVRFDDDAHEPGPQRVLGRIYAQTGMDQGEAVLRDLARHPATARFVATKLVRHFVADQPPPAAVERVASAFRSSDGDLATVSRALLDAPEAWQVAPAKLRLPQELWIAAARALPESAFDVAVVRRTLAEMGQPAFAPPSPAGFPDRSSEWSGGDALWKRLAWAQHVAERAARALGSAGAVAERMTDLLGPALHASTRRSLARAPSAALALGLGLASPEFQRR